MIDTARTQEMDPILVNAPYLSDQVLSVQDIRLGFHGRALFDGASLSVEREDRLGVVGPNGSGKSTVAHVLAVYSR